MLDVHNPDHGYTEVLPPFMATPRSFYGTGQLPKFEADLFRVQNTITIGFRPPRVPVTNLYRRKPWPGQTPHQAVRRIRPASAVKLAPWATCAASFASISSRRSNLVKFASPETSYIELEALTMDAEESCSARAWAYRTVSSLYRRHSATSPRLRH